MTELEQLMEEHIKKRRAIEPDLSDVEIARLIDSFRAGFVTCRRLAVDELRWLGPYSRGRDIELGDFIEARYLKIMALGDLDIDDHLLSVEN